MGQNFSHDSKHFKEGLHANFRLGRGVQTKSKRKRVRKNTDYMRFLDVQKELDKLLCTHNSMHDYFKDMSREKIYYNENLKV